MPDTYLTSYELPRQDPRLGRLAIHDERSKNFPFTTSNTRRSVRHHSNIGILDQGSLGSCTGNAATKNISHTSFWAKAKDVIVPGHPRKNEKYAVGVYSDAEKIDGGQGYPPEDVGSSGLSVAKVLQQRGLISVYRHAFSTDDALDAISNQSVIIGIPWFNDMFTPDANGFIVPSGQLAGGHEVCVDEINVEEQYVEFPNSWGINWGLRGRARITWENFDKLLSDNGDCTIFTP